LVWLEIFTTEETVKGESMEKIIRKQGIIRKQEDFGKQKDFSDWEKGWNWHHSTRISWGSTFLGLAIVLIGVYWFGKELGWWSFDIPICASLMIIIGVVILLGALMKKLR